MGTTEQKAMGTRKEMYITKNMTRMDTDLMRRIPIRNSKRRQERRLGRFRLNSLKVRKRERRVRELSKRKK